VSGLEAYLEGQRLRIERALEGYFPLDPGSPHRLTEAVRYSLLGGGKRIRPILLLAACEAVGGDVERAMPYGCALEMIHVYSLIHDDLPAMDDDELRRGRPTNHVVFGEALAILAGDALLCEAFDVLLRSAERDGEPQRMVRAALEIAMAGGARGMVGGQAADMAAEGREPDLATVEFIHVRKTGALLRAAVRAGAIVGGADAAALQQLSRYGDALGLAFQVADDILDAEAPSSVTGKAEGRDGARHKATYPAVLGLPAAKQRARQLLEHSLAALTELDARAEPLRGIARFVVERACAP
jgi:geranylgeranyl diphosphate synthase, type II